MTVARILVVEDDLAPLKLLQYILQNADYEVLQARSVEDAKDLLEQSIPDAVLLDNHLNSPGTGNMNEAGLTLLRWIRSTNRELPVIMLTAVPDLNILQEARSLGVSDYINKDDLKTKGQKTLAALARALNNPLTPEEVHHIEREDPFTIPYNSFLNLDSRRREEIRSRGLKAKREWAQNMLTDRGWVWMLVVGNEIVKCSETISDIPDGLELAAIAKNTNRIPFVFEIEAPSEEIRFMARRKRQSEFQSAWSPTSGGDCYPTLDTEFRTINGNLELRADLDTGSPITFLNLNRMAENRLIEFEEVPEWLDNGRALIDSLHGENYVYFNLPLEVSVKTPRRSKRGEMLCRCVLDWERKKSPFKLINPNREALVGRNVLQELRLVVRLDGRRHRSVVEE